MSPTYIDLFAGAGGLSLGLGRAGWRLSLAVDNSADALKTFERNHPSAEVLRADIRELNARALKERVGRPDWIVGGPPCQGFSTVGRRDRKDPRNALLWEYLRLVREIQPANILIENVVGLRDMDFVAEVQSALADIGYATTPFILRAADYGVPQLRKRIFFVGNSSGKVFIPPRPTHGRRAWVSVWDAIGDLPALQTGQEVTEYDKEPESDYQRTMRTGSSLLQGHRASRHPDYLVEAISFIPDGGNRRHIPDELQPKSGFHNSYSRLHSASPAVAVTQNMGKPSGTRCIHPFQHRGLTAREGARLQGFPDRYHFSGGITSQRLQVANAVPPLLAEVLGQQLMRDASYCAADVDNLELDAIGQFAMDVLS